VALMTRWWTGQDVAEAVEATVPGAVARTTDVACYLEPSKLLEAMTSLRDGAGTDFVHLTSLCGVDYWDRFEVVYHLQSFDLNQAATVKVEVSERDNPQVPSVVPLWHGAWMQECEAYDMFGIKFDGHPNLYRILLWEGYPGWPLRKDFLSMPGGLQPGLEQFHGEARRELPPVKVVES
jgi:NADH/F420H2 dehydrogenase subunit C